MSTPDTKGNIILGIFLALGLTLSGYFIGQTMYNAKVALNTAEAKGLAERRVKADRANWQVFVSNIGKSREEVPKLYETTEKNQATIIKILRENGLTDDEIEIGVLDYRLKEYRDEDQKLVDEEHRIIGSISIETDKVHIVSKARSAVNRLISQGIDVTSQNPTYHFTKLNEIKPEMLREATKNARIAANEFADNAGVTVGGIRSARQGSFNVRDVGSNYGDTKKKEKDVRVVTNITFYLTD